MEKASFTITKMDFNMRESSLRVTDTDMESQLGLMVINMRDTINMVSVVAKERDSGTVAKQLVMSMKVIG